MHILMGFNTKFLIPALTTIYSLLKNNDNVVLHIVYRDLSESGKKCVELLEQVGSNQKIVFHEVKENKYRNLKTAERYSIETWYRFMASDILDESIDRVLWLDSDIIVKGNLEELYTMDMEDKSFAAVWENTSNPQERLGIQPYVNAGVLLMNLSKLRQTGKMQDYWDFANDENYSLELLDQDALNIIFYDDIKLISNIWNMFPIARTKEIDEEMKNEFEQIKIIHFISKKKPWQEESSNYWETVSAEREYSHMCYDLYLRYLGEMTAYLEENTMAEQKKITDEVEVLISESKGKEKEVIQKIYDIIDSGDDDLLGIYLYSRILKSSLVRFTDNLIERMYGFVHDRNINQDTQLYIFKQIEDSRFLEPCLQTDDSAELLWKWHIQLVNVWKKRVIDKNNGEFKKLSYDERNHNLYVVITSQFLSEQHGPTKTALDRCFTIVKKLNKQVVLINTAEVLSDVGKVPMYKARIGNYFERLLQEDTVHWKGIDVPYVQCGKNMPNTCDVYEVVMSIYEMKPECIIDIGGMSMVANICSSYIPVIAIGLCPSELTHTTETYQIVSKTLSQSEKNMLAALGFDESSVVEGLFTSGLMPQSKSYSKDELNIEEQKTNIVIVGGRLEYEISQEFVEMLVKLQADEYKIHFCGRFQTYEEWLQDYPKLKELTVYHGMVEDMLSFMEYMDIYINPTRRGGGTSAVEALSKGVPVITVNYGDVYANAGDSFAVNNYDEMYNMILKYRSDKEFYQERSLEAVSRSERLLDTDGEFVRILEECRKRELNVEIYLNEQ